MKKKWEYIFICLFVSITTNAQIITTVSHSSISNPQQLAFDKFGNLYIGENFGNQVLKMDTAGNITVFAGTGATGYAGDSGLATLAKLYYPSAVATDTFGNVYIADGGNNRIRRVDISTGIITTIAGTGTIGFSGDNGPATNAEFHSPAGLLVDKFGNIYISDNANFRIRKINDSGIIHTIGGTGTYASTGDGGLAIAADMYPTGNLWKDNFGNLYFIDSFALVRQIDTNGIIHTVAGNKTNVYNGDNIPADSAGFLTAGIAIDPDNQLLYISDNGNNRIRMVDADGIIHTVAGNGISGNGGDGGPAISAEINQLCGIAFDYCGNLYIDGAGDSLKKVSFNPYCWPLKVPQVVSTEVNIYPNPAYEVINIDGVKEPENYALLNISGIIEQRGTLKKGNNSIGIEALPPGVYLLELVDEDGEKTVKKIVKQ